MGLSDLLLSTFESLVSGLLSPHCYDELVLKQHFFDVACNKMLLSKILGYAILVGSLLVKLPQIVKIKWNKSGVGISVFAESIMLIAIFGTIAYGYTSGYALSVYGDSYFLFIQTLLIILLVLYYQKRYLAVVVYLGSYGLLFLSDDLEETPRYHILIEIRKMDNEVRFSIKLRVKLRA